MINKKLFYDLEWHDATISRMVVNKERWMKMVFLIFMLDGRIWNIA